MYSQYHAALSAAIARGACELWSQNIRLSMRLLRQITADAVTGSILSWVDFSQPHRSFWVLKDSCPYSALRSYSDNRLAAFAALCLPIHHFDFLFAFSCALHSTCCHQLTQNNHQDSFLVIGFYPLTALTLWLNWSMDAIKAIIYVGSSQFAASSQPILLARAKTSGILGGEFERHGWPDLPTLSSADSQQCCAIETSFDPKAERWKNWWDDSFATYLSQRNTRKFDRSQIGKRLSFNRHAAAASKKCQNYQLDQRKARQLQLARPKQTLMRFAAKSKNAGFFQRWLINDDWLLAW